MSWITLLTDFGTKDPYVGPMKGVIYSINPAVRIVDISHEVAPQNVAGASLLLLATYRFFPKGTIHVVVIDPGVGSARKILCLKSRHYFFMAPDNGILAPLVREIGPQEIRSVENKNYFLKDVSSTFHGRDIFAPVAAHLSRKKRIFPSLGPKVVRIAGSPWPEARLERNRIIGRVIHIDRYGNLITNINWSLRKKIGKKAAVALNRTKVTKISDHYAQGKPGELLAVWNSLGCMELACNLGSAENLTGARVGTEVRVMWR